MNAISISIRFYRVKVRNGPTCPLITIFITVPYAPTLHLDVSILLLNMRIKRNKWCVGDNYSNCKLESTCVIENHWNNPYIKGFDGYQLRVDCKSTGYLYSSEEAFWKLRFKCIEGVTPHACIAVLSSQKNYSRYQHVYSEETTIASFWCWEDVYPRGKAIPGIS